MTLLAHADRYGLLPATYRSQWLQAQLDSLTHPSRSMAELRAQVEQQLTTSLLRFVSDLHSGCVSDPQLRPAAVTTSFDAAAHLEQALRSGHLVQQLLLAQPTSRSYVRLVWAWQRLLDTDTAAARRVRLPVALNLERLRWEPAADSFYLAVNIPAYTLQAVRGSRVVRTHRIVVGKPESPTPELYSRIATIETAPSWCVPAGIAANEMLPQLQRDPGSLADRGLELYSAGGRRINPYRVAWKTLTPGTFPYQVRQAPSVDNALGRVVFRFANAHAVYLHDTPAKAVFRQPQRALSHGCVRVAEPLALMRYLLQRDDAARAEATLAQTASSLARNCTRSVTLAHPVPLQVRYLTCEADGAALQQWPDLYQRDVPLQQAWQAAQAPAPEVWALR